MADSVQTVREFTQSLLSDLSNGVITAHEAMAACQQYSFLREQLHEASFALSQAAVVGDEDLTQALIALISRASTRLSEMPSFQSQQPDLPETEKDIRDVARLQKLAADRLHQAATSPSGSHQGRRRAFIHDLVTHYSSTVPTISDQQIEHLVDTSAAIAAAASENATGRFAEVFMESLDQTTEGLPREQKEGLQAYASSVMAAENSFVAEQVDQTKRNLAMFEALLDAPNLRRPDVFVDVLLHAPAQESPGVTLTRADKLARVAEALEKSAAGQGGGKLQFFSASGAKGMVGGLQKGADGILSLVGEPLRDMILHEKVNGTLRSMLTNTQRFTDRLGETFVQSSLFTHIAQDLTRQLAEKPSGGQVRTVFDDVFSSVFRGPLSPALIRGTEENLLNYFELGRANAAAPKNRTFLPPGLLPWDIFRVFDSTFSPLSAARRAQIGKAGLPLFELVPGGAFTNFISNSLSSLVDRVTMLSLINPRLPAQLTASRRAAAIPTPLFEDMPRLVACVVIIVILLLYVLPTPLNLNQLSHSTKVSSLLSTLSNSLSTSVSDGGGGGSSITIGPATLTCANISGAHKYQNDPSWANINCQSVRPDAPACRPPTECTVGASGCGSTSAAIILSAFGSNTGVPDVWNAQHQDNGYAYYNKSCGSYWSGPINILRGAGLSVFQVDIQEISSVLKNCGLILAFVYEAWSSGAVTGHIIVISGISQEGGAIKVTTLDPMRPPGYVSTVTNNPKNSGDIDIRGAFGVVR